MKTRYKVITAVVVLGVAGAGYGVYAQRASATNSLSAESAPTTTLPPGTPVGFNASKTEFVLPHNLGYLPAPELALAKTDSAYASGLANAGDWMRVKLPISTPPKDSGPTAQVLTWYYVGLPNGGGAGVAVGKSYLMELNSMIAGIDGAGMVKVIRSTPTPFIATGLNGVWSTGTVPIPGVVPKGAELVAPSNLEIQAGPVGTLSVKGSQLPSFCVPTPEAILANGKAITSRSLPVIAAGPSVTYSVTNPSASNAAAQVLLYDKGVATCNNFN